jgi:protein-disulfide isomerase
MIEEFGDFECPPCGSLHPVLKTMKSEFGPKVVIVFREFPLVAKHAHALAAARAAEAAGLQGKFWEMHDLLYENQKTWHEASDAQPLFEEYATRIGLAHDQFKRDITSEVVNRRIALDRERGDWIGVNSTPTVFLNGRELPLESLESAKLRELISAEIISAGG